MTDYRVERAVTFKQPWASLIVAGIKDVENRSKPFPLTLDLPCRIGVHAGRTVDSVGLRHPATRAAVQSVIERHPLTVPAGALVGYVTVTGCHSWRDCVVNDGGGTDPSNIFFCSDWANWDDDRDVWHWQLRDAESLPEPVPMRGALGLWRLPEMAVPRG